jgi:hypothetical protein
MDNSNKIILDLCGGSGSWSKPYKDAGYDVRIITLPDYDVRTYTPPQKVYGILAAPPCEAFSNAGRGHIKNPSMDLEVGLDIVNACLNIIQNCEIEKFWALENPATGELVNHIGKPIMTFQPYEYGDGWAKKTAIWGDFQIPTKTHTWENCPKLNLYIRPGRGKPSLAFQHKSALTNIPQFEPFKDYIKSDYDLRSIAAPGFVKAFFEVNKQESEDNYCELSKRKIKPLEIEPFIGIDISKHKEE